MKEFGDLYKYIDSTCEKQADRLVFYKPLFLFLYEWKEGWT